MRESVEQIYVREIETVWTDEARLKKEILAKHKRSLAKKLQKRKLRAEEPGLKGSPISQVEPVSDIGLEADAAMSDEIIEDEEIAAGD